MIRGHAPVDEEAAFRIDRQGARGFPLAGKKDPALVQLDPGGVQVQLERPRSQGNAHLPAAHLPERLRSAGRVGGGLLPAQFLEESRLVKAALRIHRENPLAASAHREDQPSRFQAGLAQIPPQQPSRVLDERMPQEDIFERSHPPQNAVRLTLRRDVRHRQGVGAKEIVGRQALVRRQNDVARPAQFPGQKRIRADLAPAREDHARMVRAQVGEQDIEAHRRGPLGGELVDQPGMDLARPIEPELVGQTSIQAIAHRLDAVIADSHKPQVGGHRGRAGRPQSHPPVVADPLQPVEKIKPGPVLAQPLRRPDRCQHSGANQNGNTRARLHHCPSHDNRKPRATQYRSGLKCEEALCATIVLCRPGRSAKRTAPAAIRRRTSCRPRRLGLSRRHG